MKNKLFLISLILTFFTTTITFGVDSSANLGTLEDINPEAETSVFQKELDENVDLNELEMEEQKEQTEVKNEEMPVILHKKPISKKKLVKKFLLAMFSVLISSGVLYVGLTIYNKVRDGVAVTQVKTPEGTTPLSTPTDMENAVKTFLDKTKW